ncbi:MAG: hypothetical protein AB8G26_17945 [Ilumatobacter sp.]
MAQLILLVVAAAWLAVLLPPMLRSRVENRPNSSVTDFRRQLTRLQNTATPPRGAVRAMGRPLAPSPLARAAAPGRPGQPTLRSGVTRHTTPSEMAAARSGGVAAPSRRSVDVDEAPRFRSHGDPTGGEVRPQARERIEAPARRRSADPSGGVRRHADPTGGQPRAHSNRETRGAQPRQRGAEVRVPAKQRRANVVFVLAISTVCSLFLAATTASEFMVYVFAFSFLALTGYVYMLRQARLRESGVADTWSDFR